MATSTTNYYVQTIPSGGTTSPGGRFDRLVPAGIAFPSEWTAATLSIQVSLDGTNWLDLPTEIGTFAGAANKFQPLDPAFFIGPNFYRFVSGANQAADRDLTVIAVEI